MHDDSDKGIKGYRLFAKCFEPIDQMIPAELRLIERMAIDIVNPDGKASASCEGITLSQADQELIPKAVSQDFVGFRKWYLKSIDMFPTEYDFVILRGMIAELKKLRKQSVDLLWIRNSTSRHKENIVDYCDRINTLELHINGARLPHWDFAEWYLRCGGDELLDKLYWRVPMISRTLTTHRKASYVKEVEVVTDELEEKFSIKRGTVYGLIEVRCDTPATVIVRSPDEMLQFLKCHLRPVLYKFTCKDGQQTKRRRQLQRTKSG